MQYAIKTKPSVGLTPRQLTLLLAIFYSGYTSANKLDECLLTQLKRASDEATVAELRVICKERLKPRQQGAMSRRFEWEYQTEFNPYVITPHKMNYILPASYTDNIHRQAYAQTGEWAENINQTEAKFQLSIKVPLKRNRLFFKNDALYFGMTLQFWWQVYSDNISKPFRETNYQPEIFYLAPTDWHPFGGNTGFGVGLEHQSNGRSQLLSRSWNRLYGSFFFEKDNFALSLRPWVRLNEHDKQGLLDDGGDDNPDIDDFMGHYELHMGYQWDDYELNFTGRENFATHKGFAEIGFTFPVLGRLRGYVQYTTGYGESLIDYNHKQNRLGIGIALTNAL